jgi:hypothetical protein
MVSCVKVRVFVKHAPMFFAATPCCAGAEDADVAALLDGDGALAAGLDGAAQQAQQAQQQVAGGARIKEESMDLDGVGSSRGGVPAQHAQLAKAESMQPSGATGGEEGGEGGPHEEVLQPKMVRECIWVGGCGGGRGLQWSGQQPDGHCHWPAV